MVERQQELKRGSNVDDSLSNTNSTELSTEKGLNLRRFSNISMKKLRNIVNLYNPYTTSILWKAI
uniref:Uncharacterized protein n=1 Tax=Meloidogyne enterolobii TaxID=390850 RepID=A0A6V7XQV9_MELEN|nr:unnamed protein product [Meloidogyne enterolobii]